MILVLTCLKLRIGIKEIKYNESKKFNIQSRKKGVLAVVTINDLEKTNYLCDALLNGGISMIELTLRTDNAFKIINHISKNYAEIVVGAGTILSTAQLEKAIESGASFGVAPGIDPMLLRNLKS